MTIYTAVDFAQRQKQVQRQNTIQWMKSLAQQSGISTAQTFDETFLGGLILPAQASVSFTLDEPGGDRLQLTVFPNGSLVLQNTFEYLGELDEKSSQEVLFHLSECISDLFHDDILRYSHALAATESVTGIVESQQGYALRSIAQVGTVSQLCELACESLVLKEILLNMLQSLLSGQDHAY